jgi:hypothetical protein
MHLPLHARVEARYAHSSIRVLTGDFHLPDGLRWRGLGDLIDCSIEGWRASDAAFIVFDVTVCEGLGIAAKEGIVGRCGVERNGSGFGGFVELEKWNGAVEARQLASCSAGDTGSEYAVVAVIEKDERKLPGRVGRDERGAMLRVEPVRGVRGIRDTLQGEITLIAEMPEDVARAGTIGIIDFDQPVLVTDGND